MKDLWQCQGVWWKFNQTPNNPFVEYRNQILKFANCVWAKTFISARESRWVLVGVQGRNGNGRKLRGSHSTARNVDHSHSQAHVLLIQYLQSAGQQLRWKWYHTRCELKKFGTKEVNGVSVYFKEILIKKVVKTERSAIILTAAVNKQSQRKETDSMQSMCACAFG